jgi:hypothetical protein
MSRRFPHQPTRDDHEEIASPDLTKLIFLAMGIAVLLGFLSGLIWTVYHLVHNRLE